MSTAKRFVTAVVLALLLLFLLGVACGIAALLASFPTPIGVAAFVVLVFSGAVALFMHALKD